MGVVLSHSRVRILDPIIDFTEASPNCSTRRWFAAHWQGDDKAQILAGNPGYCCDITVWTLVVALHGCGASAFDTHRHIGNQLRFRYSRVCS
jgi:hypothetical protein